MGSADADEDQRPVHRVHVSEFFVGRFPVTQDEYARFVRGAPYPPPVVASLPAVASGGRDRAFVETAAGYSWNGADPPPGRATHPVVLVRYDDALAYCQWLGEETGRQVRLPTEAEWERAARGGVEGLRYPWGDDLDPSRCHFLNDPAAKHERGTRPTGTYPPNPYGLYDVAGNVWEWVSDWYAPDYYSSSATRDPRGPDAGAMRIVRGGSWVNADPGMLRVAYRHRVPPDTYAYSVGFRVVCVP